MEENTINNQVSPEADKVWRDAICANIVTWAYRSSEVCALLTSMSSIETLYLAVPGKDTVIMNPSQKYLTKTFIPGLKKLGVPTPELDELKRLTTTDVEEKN